MSPSAAIRRLRAAEIRVGSDPVTRPLSQAEEDGSTPIPTLQSCRVGHATRCEVSWMIRAHYLHHWPGVTVCTLAMSRPLAGGLISDIGLVVFALPPRETAKRYGGVTWELARLWIIDAMPKNSESWLLGRAAWHVRHVHPEVEVLVSYADPSAGHSGVIYRAAGWRPDGRTDDDRKTPRFDYTVAGKHYSRRAHVPNGAEIVRVPRVSKYRFVLRLEPRSPQRPKRKK